MVSSAPKPTTKPKPSPRPKQVIQETGGNLSTGILVAVWGSMLLGMGTQMVLSYQQLLERTKAELQQSATLKATVVQSLKELNLDKLAEQLPQLNDKVLNNQGYFALIKRIDDSDKVVFHPQGVSKPSLQDIPTDDSARLTQLGGNLIAYSSAVSPSGNLREKIRVMAVVPEAAVGDRFVQTNLLTITGTAILLGLVILWYVAYLNRRLKPLVDRCEEVTKSKGGDSSSVSGSSLDRLEIALHQMIQQIERHEEELRLETAQAVQVQERQRMAVQMQKEQEASEQEVGFLLEVVSSIEEGDLTVEAEVSDRATGLVADTLNRLRERLAETIARVLATAQQVAMGAEELQTLARTVAANTVEQAQSVAQGRALTEQVAISAQSSADQVKIANQALQEVQKTVEAAQSAISKLTEGIGVLQKGSAQIVQRMKTLGEFVGLAEQFVQDQSQIASLTQVLAINATLVAARAAEQRDPKQFIGVAREFEAIAEQVNSLATQTNQGLTVLRQRTGQIQAVVSAVDTEVQGLGGLVAGFTSGVEQSATAFQSVRQVTSQVVEVGKAVTESSLEIATAADSTAKYMSEIATLAEQTANLTSTARYQAETMGSIAQELLAGIRFFRLPEAMMATVDQLAQGTEQVTVDTTSQEILQDEEFIDEWEDDLDYEDTSATISQTEEEEDLPFMPTSGIDSLSLEDMEEDEMPVVGSRDAAKSAMEELETDRFEGEFESGMAELDEDSPVLDEDFDVDEFATSSVELAKPEYLEPNYTTAPTLHLQGNEPPTLIEDAEPDLDFDMLQDELESADDLGISLVSIEEDLQGSADYDLDVEDELEEEMASISNPQAVTVMDTEAVQAVNTTAEMDVEIELEEMTTPQVETVINTEALQGLDSIMEEDIDVEIELVESEPMGGTILRYKQDEEEGQEPLGGTALLDEEDELEFSLLEEEQESSPISADFDTHFDALVSSFTEESPQESSTELQEVEEIPVLEVSSSAQLDQPSADFEEIIASDDSPELPEESIEIFMEDDNEDDVSQETINQIFDLELITEEQPSDTPSNFDVLEAMEFPDDDRAFLIDEGVDINQPESAVVNPETETNQPFELVESDDPMQELIALSEQLDDGIEGLNDSKSAKHQDSAMPELFHDDLNENLDDFLVVSTNNREEQGSESDPFDFDLLSEETL